MESDTSSKSQSSRVSAQASSREVHSEIKAGKEVVSSNRQFAVSQPVLTSKAPDPEEGNAHGLESADTDYKKSTTLEKKVERSNSVSAKVDKNQNEIQKDVDRTFQGDKYFKRESVKKMLFTVLHQFTKRNNLRYVQGMNFIAGFVIHHSLDYELCFNIFMFIQGRRPDDAITEENLEMENLYRMTTLDKYYALLEDTIALNCSSLYKTVFKDNTALINNLFVDWVLTLGMSKIPIEFSGEYLEYLVLYGWTYFFKFFGSFMREIETMIKPFLSKIKRKTKKVTLYNNFDIEHLPEKVKRSISPIKSRRGFGVIKKFFNKDKSPEAQDPKITHEKRICFKVKKSKNTLANEEMYMTLRKAFRKLTSDRWKGIFDNAFSTKVSKKKIVLKIQWTKYNNFSELN